MLVPTSGLRTIPAPEPGLLSPRRTNPPLPRAVNAGDPFTRCWFNYTAAVTNLRFLIVDYFSLSLKEFK